jgi:DNA-binding NtrC family response regulator
MDKPQRTVPPDRPTILLIEDDASLGVLFGGALEDAGFAVAQAGDVDDAVRQARACAPEVIVIALRSRSSAASTLDRLRHNPATRDHPLIVLRRAGPSVDSCGPGRVDVLPWSPADLDLLLEHVWRIVNTRVLGRTALPATPNRKTGSSDLHRSLHQLSPGSRHANLH